MEKIKRIMTVILAIGGSILGNPENGLFEEYREVINSNDVTGIVVGGGRLARMYISKGREFDMSDSELDRLGIQASQLNARLLAGIIENGTFCRNYSEIKEDCIPILGGVEVGQTTDTVAAELGSLLDANKVIFATSVDRVYDSDPQTNPDAKGYESINYNDLENILDNIEAEPGHSAPIELKACRVLKSNSIVACVVDGEEIGNVVSAINGSNFSGTIVNRNR